MNPNYVHTITLYHQDDGKWLQEIYRNCFWKSGITVLQNGTTATQKNTYTVRIPAERICAGMIVCEGDIVVLGECHEEITGKSPTTATELLRRHKPNAFLVTAFSDNTGHRLGKHYRLGG